jgi:hypothetical protein
MGLRPTFSIDGAGFSAKGGTAAVDSAIPRSRSSRIAFANWSACSTVKRRRSNSTATPFPKQPQQTDIAADLFEFGGWLFKCFDFFLIVSGSNLFELLKGRSKPRGSYLKAEDAELLPAIRRLVDTRPTYGYRRIAALLNRERRVADQPVASAKRVHRIMGNSAMLVEKHTAVCKRRIHDGKVMVMRSNLRWCSDGLEFACRNGDVVRLAFIIAFHREIIAWTAVANAGISGSDVRDMMPKAVDKRFGATPLAVVIVRPDIGHVHFAQKILPLTMSEGILTDFRSRRRNKLGTATHRDPSPYAVFGTLGIDRAAII